MTRLATRFATYAAGSILLWIAAVGAAYWYLRRPLPAAVRALLVAAVLVVANLVVAVVLLRRRSTSRREIG